MHATNSDSNGNAVGGILFMSLELSKDQWKLTFSVAGQTRLRRRTVEGGKFDRLLQEITYAQKAFRLPEGTRVVSCYEAGRDGFWLHRALLASGLDNRVLDASSLEVDRRQKRAKTDRLDGERLVRALLRYEQGDRAACRVVPVPSAEDEDARHLQRELQTLRDERIAHENRRELGALLGLTPVPFASGQLQGEQGLSKTGNSRLRSLTIELAWLWLLYQPSSALSKWYQERFGAGNRRVRRIGIVALARKLMGALWKYVEGGEIPAGAVLKTEKQLRRHRRTIRLTAKSAGTSLSQSTAL